AGANERVSPRSRWVARSAIARAPQPLSIDARRRAPFRAGAPSDLRGAEFALERGMGSRSRAARQRSAIRALQVARRARMGRLRNVGVGRVCEAVARR